MLLFQLQQSLASSNKSLHFVTLRHIIVFFSSYAVQQE